MPALVVFGEQATSLLPIIRALPAKLAAPPRHFGRWAHGLPWQRLKALPTVEVTWRPANDCNGLPAVGRLRPRPVILADGRTAYLGSGLKPCQRLK
jgi:hypothetical protein